MFIPQPSCYTVPHHSATNNYKHSPPNSSKVTHGPDIPKPVVFYTPSHLLSLLSYKRFATLLRCRYGPAYGNDRLQKHQKVVTKVCAMSSHVSHPLPEHPPPLSLSPSQPTIIATKTQVSCLLRHSPLSQPPTPTRMIYCPRGSAASLTLQYLSPIHVLGVRSQSKGTARRTYFSHCAWIGQQKLFTSTCRVLPSINRIKGRSSRNTQLQDNTQEIRELSVVSDVTQRTVSESARQERY